MQNQTDSTVSGTDQKTRMENPDEKNAVQADQFISCGPQVVCGKPVFLTVPIDDFVSWKKTEQLISGKSH